MRYKKQHLGGKSQFQPFLGQYPVYCESIYKGREPMKVVGLRENEIELEGDYSGGTHNVCQKSWFSVTECFSISTVCEEQLKPRGCQVHNVNCCGGGSDVTEHVRYWDNLI